jgi:thioredoxin 1
MVLVLVLAACDSGPSAPQIPPSSSSGESIMTTTAAHPVALTAENFSAITAEGLVLVDFWAEWCGPCKMMLPILDQASQQLAGKATIAKVNVDECPNIAGQFGISSIPALLLFKDGKVIDQRVGVTPLPTLVAWLQANME